MRSWLWWSLICCLAVGCGHSGPFEYVPVSGKITYEDGTPLPGSLELTFIAQDAPPANGAVPRDAVANVNAQGVFTCVTSYKYGDGLTPGKHKVVVRLARGQTGVPIVPKAYTSSETTPLVIDTADAPLVIKVPKP